MISVSGLSKAYGEIQALADVSFDVTAGEIVGLLGPNGAGKSTIIKTLTGYLQPDLGKAIIGGLDVMLAPEQTQALIGYLPENAPLYPELTVYEYLQMMADLRQIPDEEQRDHLVDAIYSTGLEERINQPIAELSKGYRQRVGIAQAILHRPELLILDEPTVGLDPAQIIEIRNLIKRLSEHSTVLFSTHILPEVEVLCDRVLMLINGEIRLDSKLEDISRTADVLLVLDKAPADVKSVLESLEAVAAVTQIVDGNSHRFKITGQPNADLSPIIFDLAVKQGWQVRELRPVVQTLESVFNAQIRQGEDA
ncbi:MAG: ATP-binding cassette domain-containing protein [Chloroflexota bacterium]